MTAQFTWEAMSFLSKYGMLLDQDRLEDWVELFEPQSEYKVYSRENEELGLPAPLMWCDNRAMLSDRIQSYRNVNEHNFHWARHIIGMPHILHAEPDSLHFQAGYSFRRAAPEKGLGDCRYRLDQNAAGSTHLAEHQETSWAIVWPTNWRWFLAADKRRV
jgi:3-phenylpropionate/cinnamic acid dioxygenase small subunit